MVIKKFVLLLLSLFPITTFEEKDIISYVGNEISIIDYIPDIPIEIIEENPVIKTYSGNFTGYGPDCKGCSGQTASGYNVKNTIYYNDKEYGKVRILAADKSLPFGTIVNIRDVKNSDDILAIVLDRGSAIGFNKKSKFDLLYSSEKQSNKQGKQKAKFDILRLGF